MVRLDDDVARFAADVGTSGPVTIAGTATRGGAIADVRAVAAPSGIDWIQPAEMTARCGAGTTVEAIDAALAAHGQCIAAPTSGTLGGALAVGHSSLRRLGWGPIRDIVLQIRYVSAAGEIVTAGGPTVKNVSGFDLCRLLVGSRGTLGFLADVIVRTRPRPTHEQWYTSDREPWALLGELYRPASVLWNGTVTWVLLDGHPGDIDHRAAASALTPVASPPTLPPYRWSVGPGAIRDLDTDGEPFIAEIGVGTVHRAVPQPPRALDRASVDLQRRVKVEFDPDGRLNPGIDVLMT